MKCHEEYKQLISAYLDDELSLEQKDAVNNHLVDCPACQKYLKELQNLSVSVKALKNETLSLDLEQRLNNLNRAKKQESVMQKTTFIRILKTAAPFVVVVFVLTFSLQMFLNRALHATLRNASYSPSNTQIASRKSVPAQFPSAGQRGGVENKTGWVGGSAGKVSWNDTATTRRADEYYQTTKYFIDEKQKFENKLASEKVQAVLKSPSAYSVPMMARERSENTSLQSDSLVARAAVAQNVSGLLAERWYPDPVDYNGVQQAPAANTEQYDTINENEFSQVTDNPLSTFSIDVDTASYSNIRRFLNNNQLPPSDAVRIEEMINYFKYNYPQPGWNQPFSITLEHGVCPWNQAHQLVLVGLQGKELSARQTPVSNLVFLIDVSGSMGTPEKLPLLKESLKQMVATLRPQERVSIVVYAGNAGVVLDSAPGYDKGLIMSAIDNLQAGGSTAGGQGIQLAYAIARKNFIQNGNNRVILATDGDFNVGISDDAQLVRLIEQQRQSGIFLTVLGFGTDNYKDAKMQKLADKGNGNYFYIDSLDEGKKVLVDELGSTLIAIAKDVKVQIEFNPKAVKAYRLIGYEKRKLAKEDFNDDTKDAGELGAGHSVTALYEIVPAGSWESVGTNVDPLKYQKQVTQKPFWGSDKEMLTVKLRYKEPKSETSQLITKVLNQPSNTFGLRWFGNSDNLQFASAVAEFGMLLRDSNFKSASSYQSVLQRAQNCSYNDPRGYKNEFLSLVQKAAMLDNRQPQVPVYQPQYQNYPIPVEDQSGYNQKSQ